VGDLQGFLECVARTEAERCTDISSSGLAAGVDDGGEVTCLVDHLAAKAVGGPPESAEGGD